MFKTHQLIMLPSKQAKIGMVYKRLNAFEDGFAIGIITNPEFANAFNKGYLKNNNLTSPQHLYIISDEEIKEGDWCYNKRHNKISKIDKNAFNNVSWVSDNLDIYSKIIASTDEELNLPLINQDFIDEFSFKGIENEYVKVEYISIGTNEDQLGVPVNYEEIKEKFIIKTKDNYVDNIQFLKENWNREEVKKLCRLAWDNGFSFGCDLSGDDHKEDEDRWIKENI